MDTADLEFLLPQKVQEEKDHTTPVKQIEFNLYSPGVDDKEFKSANLCSEKSEKNEKNVEGSRTKQIAFSLYSADKKDRVVSEYLIDEAHQQKKFREEEKTKEISLLKTINERIGEMSDFDDHFENCELAQFDYFNLNRREESPTPADFMYVPKTMDEVMGVLNSLNLDSDPADTAEEEQQIFSLQEVQQMSSSPTPIKMG